MQNLVKTLIFCQAFRAHVLLMVKANKPSFSERGWIIKPQKRGLSAIVAKVRDNKTSSKTVILQFSKRYRMTPT